MLFGWALGFTIIEKTVLVPVGLLINRLVSWPTAPVPSNFDQGIALYGYWATDITGTVPSLRYPRGLDWFGLVPVPTGVEIPVGSL